MTSIPHKRAHAEFESNAVKSNMKEQQRLEKNISVLKVEEAYALRLLDLDSRDINMYRQRMNEKTSKIKSHLDAANILKMKKLESAGKLKGVGNKPASASYAILAAAEKRLNLKPRPKTSLPVRQHPGKCSPNIEDNKSESPSLEESQTRDCQPGSLVKQPSFSNISQMLSKESQEQDNNASWARPSPKPRIRPQSSYVPATRYGYSGTSDDKAPTNQQHMPTKIVIPTGENQHDNSVSDVEDLPSDDVFIPCHDDPPSTHQDEPPKPAPRPKHRRLPVPPKRREVRENENGTPTNPELTSKRERCAYKGTPMRAFPTPSKIEVTYNDGVHAPEASHTHKASKYEGGIPVKNIDARNVRKRLPTPKYEQNGDGTLDRETNSKGNIQMPNTNMRPKTAMELGYADIHRNRRVRSPDHSRGSRPSSRQTNADDIEPKRQSSRRLPVRPDQPPCTKIPIRPATSENNLRDLYTKFHHRAMNNEPATPSGSVPQPAEPARPVPNRRLIRPQTAKPNVNFGYSTYTGSISRNDTKHSTSDYVVTLPPPMSPRGDTTARNENEPVTVLSPRISKDPTSQSMTNIPRYVPIAPPQRADIVPRSPRVAIASSSKEKRLNASVIDRMNDFTSVLPYASPGNSVNNKMNLVPEVLKNKMQSENMRESNQSYPENNAERQSMHMTNGDVTSHTTPLMCHPHNSANHTPEQHSSMNHYKPNYSNDGPTDQARPRTAIPRPGSGRPGSARPRAPAQPSKNHTQDTDVKSANDFRNTLSRSYDNQEAVLSSKPPRPLQRPTTAAAHVSSSIPRPRTGRKLPCTPQHRFQLETYPTNSDHQGSVVTQSLVHSPRPPSAPPERRMKNPESTEYVTHEVTVPAPSKIAVRTKTKKPQYKFNFDSHKVVTDNHAKDNAEGDDIVAPKVYSSFEEAMADYLERVASKNIFGKEVLHGFRQSLIKLEKLKFAKIEDKMTLFLNKMDEYLERSGKVIPDWLKPLRFQKTAEEPTVVTFDPATYFKNRRKAKYQHNKQAFERQIKKDGDPKVWNGINKCRYLRIPNEMVDNSGMRTLATDQIQLMKTLKGVD